jgi:hypothetical protein
VGGGGGGKEGYGEGREGQGGGGYESGIRVGARGQVVLRGGERKLSPNKATTGMQPWQCRSWVGGDWD